MVKWAAGSAALERNKAKKLLKRNVSAFVANNGRQRRTVIIRHEINTGEARLIKQAPRSIPLANHNEVKGLVDEIKRSGVIEPSSRRHNTDGQNFRRTPQESGRSSATNKNSWTKIKWKEMSIIPKTGEIFETSCCSRWHIHR